MVYQYCSYKTSKNKMNNLFQKEYLGRDIVSFILLTLYLRRNLMP
jgi:hypothetical protein